MIENEIKNIGKLFLPPVIADFIKYYKRFNQIKVLKEERKIKNTPRFTIGETSILGKPLQYSDSVSFLFIYNEVFKKEVYRFRSNLQSPYIIDAGANIGLSVIYFKQLYPSAEIIAFEPDSTVYDILEYNIDSFDFKDVKLIKKGLWNSVTTLNFYSEGADGGRIATSIDREKLIEVQTDRLYKYLDRRVDFLKIDIEGAEYRVLEDSQDYLENVQNIFVEFHSFIGKEQYLPELLNLLKKAGFRLNINTPGLVSVNPLMQVETYLGMDMQLNIYGYRE